MKILTASNVIIVGRKKLPKAEKYFNANGILDTNDGNAREDVKAFQKFANSKGISPHKFVRIFILNDHPLA